MTSATTGSCFCKAVRYRITSAISLAVNCHCSQCKKASRGAFSSLAVVRERQLEFLTGDDSLATYPLGEKLVKHFCRYCGTPIFNRNSGYPGRCMVPLGSLDNPAAVTPTVNIHCASTLAWVLTDEGLQNFAQGYL